MSHAPHVLPAPIRHLDAKRIAATSGVIALHASLLMLMFVPLEWSPPRRDDTPMIVTDIPIVDIVPIPPPPAVIERPPVNIRPQPVPQVQAPDVPEIIFETAGPMDVAVEPIAPDIVSQSFEPPPAGPVTLAVLHGPAPTYPLVAIRRGIEGRVILLISVDAQGMPVDGQVESGSGSSLLDRAALKAVLEKWRFQPARHNGVAVAATARVPIVFQLDR